MHWLESGDVKELSSLYEPLVKPAADSLVKFLRDGLPKPSFDLWEERKGVYTYSCASAFSGLQSASAIALILGDEESFSRWDRAVHDMREAAIRQLFDPSLGRFRRGVGDDTVDASTFAAWSVLRSGYLKRMTISASLDKQCGNSGLQRNLTMPMLSWSISMDEATKT